MVLKEGIDLYKVGAYEQAILFFTEYLKTGARREATIYFYRGMSYFKLGLFHQSLKELIKYLKFYPNCTKCCVALCTSIYEYKPFSPPYWIKKYFKMLISLYPTNPEFYFMFVDVIRRFNDYWEFTVENIKYFNCLSLISKAISLNNTNWKYHYTKGNIYYKLKEYNKALKDFINASNFINDETSEDRINLTDVYFGIVACYKYKNEPNFILAQKYLSKIEELNVYLYFEPNRKFSSGFNKFKNRVFQRDVTKW